MMTPRDNFYHFLKKEPYEWTPTSLDIKDFRPAKIGDNIPRALVMEQTRYTGTYGGPDMFGINWVFVPSVGGSMEDPDEPHTFEDIEDWEKTVKFPDIDAWDWEGCARENEEYLTTDKIIHSTIYTGFFERLISFTGFENAAMDLIDEDCQPYVDALFSKLADLYIEIMHRMHKYFNVEILEIHDDWGNQRSLMFSAETHREMLVPHIQRVADAAHEEGIFIEQHSCGKIEALVPNIIESRVDTWRGQGPVLDKKWIVDTYGDQFRFGVDVRPDKTMADEEILPLTKQILADYHGKDVWVVTAFGPSSNAQNIIYDYIRSQGHI